MDCDTYEQFDIPLEKIGDNTNYLIENATIDILEFNGEPINIELPIKMSFRVVTAPPGVKGNSAGSVTKKVTLETGATIDVPLFIKENDQVVVDTRDGSYVERANETKNN
ncbi:MAG: Elongation factor P [bacterium ADurb.Bin400]|nr:MAG: Elongation factor P [bacterium ADurb.Bin400]